MADLKLVADTSPAIAALADVERRLLEQFPEAGLDLIHSLLFRVLDERPVLTARSAPSAGNGVVRLEVVLDAALVFEVVAAALGATDL